MQSESQLINSLLRRTKDISIISKEIEALVEIGNFKEAKTLLWTLNALCGGINTNFKQLTKFIG